MTKEKLDALLEKVDGLVKGLNRLGLGTDDGDVVREPQSAQSDAMLMSVISVLFFSILHSILPSSLERIKDKLKNISDRFENTEHTAKSEDAKVVSELMGDIQNAITDFQVSGNTQPGSAT